MTIEMKAFGKFYFYKCTLILEKRRKWYII